MEEESSEPHAISAKTVEPSAQKKHAAMLERLCNRSNSRKPNFNSSSTSESTAFFLSRFSHSNRSIASDLANIRLIAENPESKSQIKPDIDRVSNSIAELERLVAENSYILPSYEVRSSLKTISSLRATLEHLHSELLPQKKFAFRNKGTKKEQAASPKACETATTVSDKANVVFGDSPGFRGEVNALLLKDFRCTSLEVGEFTLSDLDNCKVRLIGSVGLRALFIHRLRNCHVYVGPVLGSILIEEVEGCIFVLASHQIRVHFAKECDFYLRLRSRPIIENSGSVRFAPYRFHYDGIESDLAEASLEEDNENWTKVDDFNWLRARQSPNWSILPENERIDVARISNTTAAVEEN